MTEVIERDATRAPVKSDTPPEPKAPRLLDQVRERIRVLHYSRYTHVLNRGGRGVTSPLDRVMP